MQDFGKIADILHKKGIGEVKVGLVLGSGLNEYGEDFPVRLPYSEVEGFPSVTVPGHTGELRYGEKNGVPVLAFAGRFHAYEGHPSQDIVFPERLLCALGAQTVILTNAAGGVNPDFLPGDIMVIDDHINLGDNPLLGPNLECFGPRFFDMSCAYDAVLRSLADAAAARLGQNLRHGVYFYMRGPSFETPAEIRAIRLLGGDAVGMSTVQETVAARHAGLRVLGLSCITNMAAGMQSQPLSHAEVMETGRRVRKNFTTLVDEILSSLTIG